MISWSDVTNIAPALTSVPAATQAAILSQVERELAASAWGARVDLGQKWLAAHIGTMYLRAQAAGASGAVVAGPIISETVGPVSRTYGSSGGSSGGGSVSAYDSTPFGQKFLELQSNLVIARIGCVL